MRLRARLPIVPVLLLWACADGVGPSASGNVPVRLSVQPPAGVSAAETMAIQGAFDAVNTYRVSVRDSVSGSLLAADTVSVTPGRDEYRFDFTFSSDVIGLPVLVTVVGLDSGLELYRGSGYAMIQGVPRTGAPTPIVLDVRYTGPGIRGTVANENGAGVAAVSVDLYQGANLVASVPTEPDGSYLFLNVATGSYSVEPTPPARTFLCPGSRDLTVTTNASIVADFAVSTSACQIDLLILSGGDVDNTTPVADLFANTPGVTTDTFFFVSQLPGLSRLRLYDVVLVFTNGIFDETTALGGQLAEYIQVGGNVVIGTFYWQGRSDSEFITPGWGALEALDPFLVDTSGFGRKGGATYTANTLGNVAIPAHPLMQGVSSIVSLSGFSAGVLPKLGTTVVASWEDGAPLVGFQVLAGGQRVVGVSLFPAAANPTQVAGDVQQLWENAITWAGDAGGPIP